jgi:MinD superfamily P-loop ATPase
MKPTPQAPFELVIVSGKGGTGKTTVSASFAALAGNAVIADCDVDASNMELLLSPTLRTKEDFTGGKQAVIDAALCTGCGRCARQCRFSAIHPAADAGRRRFAIEPSECEGCGVCVAVCPRKAVSMHPVVGGELFRSDTVFSPLVHARLKPGLGNSGKLTTLVRSRARQTAAECGRSLIIIDGPPGVGCPTIASLTGASQVLAVTEPTLSGEHDLARILELCRQFHLPVQVCVNKADINPEATGRIRKLAENSCVTFAGEIPYDEAIAKATRKGKPIVSAQPDSPAAKAITALWDRFASGS